MSRILTASLVVFVIAHAGHALAADKEWVGDAEQARVASELAEAEKLYLTGADDERLVVLTDKLSSYEVFEAPPVYESFFFHSYLEYRKGRLAEAATLLGQFKCVLQVEIGERKCSALAAAGADKVCADTMCSEMYQSYYDAPSAKTLAHVRLYQRYAADLEAKIGRHIGACGK